MVHFGNCISHSLPLCVQATERESCRDKLISTSVRVSFICPMSMYNAEEPEGNSHRSHSPTKNIINPAWASDNIYRSAQWFCVAILLITFFFISPFRPVLGHLLKQEEQSGDSCQCETPGSKPSWSLVLQQQKRAGLRRKQWEWERSVLSDGLVSWVQIHVKGDFQSESVNICLVSVGELRKNGSWAFYLHLFTFLFFLHSIWLYSNNKKKEKRSSSSSLFKTIFLFYHYLFIIK